MQNGSVANINITFFELGGGLTLYSVSPVLFNRESIAGTDKYGIADPRSSPSQAQQPGLLRRGQN
jgi:hypothetical protein